mgnify:CR=1 FL=1
MLDKIKSVDFAQHLGGEFMIYKEGMAMPVKAELAEVSVHHSDFATDTSDAATKIKRGFSIILRASKGSSLPQDMFTIENKDVGKIDVFLSPIEDDKEERPQFEAVFNADHSAALE